MIHLQQNISSLKAVILEEKVTAGLPVVTFFSQEDITLATKKTLSTVDFVKICSEPKPGTTRIVKSISIVNADSISHTVSVFISEGSVDGIIISVLLSSGDGLYYEDSAGWYVLTSDGSIKGVGATGPPGQGTDLAVANITATTLDVTSSSGTDATLPAATTTDAGLMTAAQFNNLADAFLKSVDTTDDITEGAVNKWNVTHTSEVTGATALTLNKTAISNRTAATIVGSDYLLFGDTSDSDNLKKGLVSDIITAATPSGAALTRVDDTNVTITLGGTPSTALLQAASLTLGWSGQLAISRGGTGAATAATARVNILPSLSGNTLKVLRVNAGETDVEWATSSSGGITINTTTITGGVSNRLLYNNAGTVGEITVGSSGTFLRSNGTSWEASTPTLSVTPTSGTYIRGDGTNWITSTLKLPNTATANYIPYATGANTWGESGNLKFDTISLSVLTSGAEATPTITIGSVGNGIYLPTANTLGFATNGQQRFQLDGTSFNSVTAGGGFIKRAAGAAATPAFAFQGTTDTGMWLSSNALGFAVDGVNYLTIDSNANSAHIATITGGTLTNTKSALMITATLPTTITAANVAVNLAITSAGSSSFPQRGFNIELLAGYTGNSQTVAGRFINSAAGTGNDYFASTQLGNYAITAGSNGSTTGLNVGFNGSASFGNVNFGTAGRSLDAKNSATNIGVIGFSLNTGTSPIMIGGYFGLQNSLPTFASAALMADNGSTTSDIFVARDNGTAVLTIADGGDITTTAKYISGGTIRLKGYTVATLPAGTTGDTAYVTDATAPTFLGALTGGGAVVTPVFYNGSAWVSC